MQKTLFLLLLSLNVFGQNVLKGKVFDEQKRPLQGVSIYINNSSIHTETDSSGAFQLTIPANVFKKNLLIYKQNFQTKFISNYEEETDLLITLLTDKLLDEVKITAKRSSLVNRKIAIFKKILFGNSTYTKQCELVNIEDLVLNIKSNSQFEVSFKNNIKILNHAFGYMIEIHFEKVLISHEKTFAPLNNDNYYCIFKELSPENSKEAAYWKKNREEAFKNSFRGFLISGIHTKLKSEFDTYLQNTSNNYQFPYNSSFETEVNKGSIEKFKLENLVQYDSTSKIYTLRSEKSFIIFSVKYFNRQSAFLDYRNEFTYVYLPDHILHFDKYGWTQSPWQLTGFWAETKYSAVLPQDYLPEIYDF